MCGIAGFIGHEVLRGLRRPSRRPCPIPSLTRGPDADGVWLAEDDGVALIHRRLAVIDLSAAGAQPMTSPSGRYVLSYNGEVYNFPPHPQGT